MTRLWPGMRLERLASDVTSTSAVLVFLNGAATLSACSGILEAENREWNDITKMFGFQALPVASHSPTVTDTVPSLVSHSTRGAEVYPEPRSNTRRRLLTDDILYYFSSRRGQSSNSWVRFKNTAHAQNGARGNLICGGVACRCSSFTRNRLCTATCQLKFSWCHGCRK